MARGETRPIDLLPVAGGVGIPDDAVDAVEEGLDMPGFEVRPLTGGRLVVVTLPGGRRQAVQVLGLREIAVGGPGLLLASVAAPADPDRYDAMLRLNAALSLGAVEIRTVQDRDWFVLAATLPARGLAAATCRAAVRFIAERADRLEQMLTGSDVR